MMESPFIRQPIEWNILLTKLIPTCKIGAQRLVVALAVNELNLFKLSMSELKVIHS